MKDEIQFLPQPPTPAQFEASQGQMNFDDATKILIQRATALLVEGKKEIWLLPHEVPAWLPDNRGMSLIYAANKYFSKPEIGWELFATQHRNLLRIFFQALPLK